MKFIRLLVLIVLFSVVFMIGVEARRSGGGGRRTSSRTSSRTPSRTHTHIPSRTGSSQHIPPKKSTINKFLEAERTSVIVNKKSHLGHNSESSNTKHKNSDGDKPTVYPIDKKHDVGFESINKQSQNKHDHSKQIDSSKSNPPIGFDKINTKTDVKPTNSNPIGLEHLTPVKNSPSAPPLPAGYPNQQNLGQYPSYPNYGQQNSQNIPSAPPLPGNYPNQQNLGNQHPSYPNPGQQNLQHIPSAPPLPGNYPNQQNLGNQHPSYPNPGQQNLQHIPSAPPLPGNYPNQQNLGNQYPSYPNIGQQNMQYVPSAPSFPGGYANQQNVGNQYPSYPNSGQHYMGNQYPGYPNPGQTYPGQQGPSFSQFSGSYPNQHSIGNQYPGYPYSISHPGQQSYHTWGQTYTNQQTYYPGQSNIGNPNLGFNPAQQNPNHFFNQPYPGPTNFGSNYYPNNMPSYPSTGFFGTSNNGLSNYGSHYSPYPGYTGMYSNNYNGNSYKRSFMPIPIPIPIPIPFPTSSDDKDFDSEQIHDVLKKILNKIENTKTNQTSVFLLNNSTVTPCNKEEFIYSAGVLNLTITTCTVLNCTAVSMKTSFNSSGKIIENNGIITMCLNPNATVSTNFSGTAQPKVSEIVNYWRSLCVNRVQFNQSISSGNGTNIGQNITHIGLINGTNIGLNISDVSLINGTIIMHHNISVNNDFNIIKNTSDLDLMSDVKQVLGTINSTNNEKHISYVSLENSTNIGEHLQSVFITHEQNSSYPKLDTSSNKTLEILQNTTNLDSKINNDVNFTVQNALRNSTTANNFTNPTNMSQKICEILNCSSTVFCMPTVEITCTDTLNLTCKQKMTSYTSCIRVKMCQSSSTSIDRFVMLNTTIADYDHVTNNLTERYELTNLTVITYFPPVVPTFGNFSTLNGTNTTCTSTPYSNGTSTTLLQSVSSINGSCVSLGLVTNSSVSLQVPSLNLTHSQSSNVNDLSNITITTQLPNFGN